MIFLEFVLFWVFVCCVRLDEYYIMENKKFFFLKIIWNGNLEWLIFKRDFDFILVSLFNYNIFFFGKICGYVNIYYMKKFKFRD